MDFSVTLTTSEQESLLRTDTILIFPFFLEVLTEKTGLAVADTLSVRLRIPVLQVVDSDEDTCDQNGKPSNRSSLIPSGYCHHFHTLLIPLQKLIFTWKPVGFLIFFLSLAFSYNFNAPLRS